MRSKVSYIRHVVIVAVLWMITLVSTYIQDTFSSDGELLFNLLGICHSMIRFGIIGAWGLSISQRITSPQVRRILSWISILMLCWMLMRTTRYYFVEEGLLKRLLWYGYYIPMMLIPPLALIAGLSMNKPLDYRTPKYRMILIIIGALFAALVLTNEVHQWVFYWDDPNVRTDATVHYTLFYYVLMAWEYGCGTIVFITVVIRSRIPGTKQKVLLPIVPIILLMLYGLLYVIGVPIIRAWFNDVTSITILLYISVFECVICSGLFHSCDHYQKLFDAGSLRAAITDRSFSVYSSGQGFLSKTTDLRSAVDHPYQHDNVRLSCREIHGGYVFWQDDLSEIMKTIDELQSINEELSEQKNLTKEELRIRKEQSRLKEISRIYSVMQRETSGQLAQMRQLIESLEIADTPEAERSVLDRLLLIGAYFKRRNNLLFLSETGTFIAADELRLCLEESLHTIANVLSTCRVICSEPMLLRDITGLYDLAENVLEQTLGCISSCAILIKCTERTYQMQISLQMTDDASIPVFHPSFDVEIEEGGGLVLTASIQKGGDRA